MDKSSDISSWKPRLRMAKPPFGGSSPPLREGKPGEGRASLLGSPRLPSGLAQANRNRPIDPLVVLLQQVMDAVANLPYRRLRALDKETWQGIVDLLHRTDLFDATTLKLPPKVREWAKGTTDGSAALKLQLRKKGRGRICG